MPFNNTRVRASSAEPSDPAHGHQSALTKQENNVHHTAASHLTAEALASLMVEEKPQLDVWYEEQHTHEQLALGNKTSRIGREIEEFLKDVEESVDGKTK